MRPPIDWGRHCGDLAAAAIVEASGRDPWPALGGRPGSAREALALLRRAGVRSLADLATLLLGPPLATPRLARRGDVVMAQRSLGVCRGELAEFANSGERAMLPMREVELAWRADALADPRKAQG